MNPVKPYLFFMSEIKQLKCLRKKILAHLFSSTYYKTLKFLTSSSYFNQTYREIKVFKI